MEFFASCPEGFEDALADELHALGARQVRKLKGRVTFAGEARDAQRVCLWSRLASRVLVVLARFDCRDADELYDGIYAMPWEDILAPRATVAVSARGTNDRLRNSHYVALRVKDALCDRLADEAGTRADVDTAHPDARIAVSLRGERVSVHLDLSGEPLFRRGIDAVHGAERTRGLRADYAALALMQAGWNELCDGAGATGDAGQSAGAPVLIDAGCGDAGLLLEASAMAAGRAPGLLRERWGFTAWTGHDAAAWHELVDEADRRAEQGADSPARILATDIDGQAAALARRALKRAGLPRNVIFVQPDVEKIMQKLPRPAGDAGRDDLAPSAGAIVLNVADAPFGHMNRTLELVEDLYGTPELASFPVVALARDGLVARAVGGATSRSIDIRLDSKPARIVTFASAQDRDTAGDEGPASSARVTVDVGDGEPVGVLVPESDQFAARLRKVARQRRKWAKRTGVTCYRVYDADLPDYSAAIDLYETCGDRPQRWMVLAEYAAPRSVDSELAQARLLDMLAISPRVLVVAPERVIARSRTRSRGGSQYARMGGTRTEARSVREGASPEHSGRENLLIREGGLTFEVDFESYLDTGIFLDHRVTRDLVRQRAQGCRRFLNLFAYTGTATCYAADGGAQQTTTVDLSNTYLEWARRNMARNGFTGPAHRFVRADVLTWIDREVRAGHRWDLIFCDPPTFSNSSKMGQRTWDVQRDHVELLSALARLLTPGGCAIFSCNLRTFKPDTAALERAEVALEDISAQTIPEDFARNPRIHRCYLVRAR